MGPYGIFAGSGVVRKMLPNTWFRGGLVVNVPAGIVESLVVV
jgi:hypothetical protein